MKKSILLTLLFFGLFSCEISPRKTQAKSDNIVCPTHECITYDRRTWDGYEWAIFSSTRYDAMSPFVINLTKERLEIEKLQLEIEYYKNLKNK